MAKKPKHKETEEMNEFEQAEKEAEANPEAEAALEAQVPASDDGEVKKPVLQGHDKKEYGKPKFERPADNNMSREDIGETEE